jgi:serine/threonine protein kinase
MPSKVAHYRVRSKIGEGGMGVVYAAEDTRLGRTVAIKMIRESSDNTMRERLWARSARSRQRQPSERMPDL